MISSGAMGGCSAGVSGRLGIRTISGAFGGVCGPAGSCAASEVTKKPTPEAAIIRDARAGMMRLILTVSSDALNKPYRLLRSEEHTSELQSRGHLVCRL